jgi:ferredoxin
MQSSSAPIRFNVAIEPAQVSYEARADVPILQSAREAGLMLPSSCRNGTCRTCICRLLEGRVRYAIDWPGLSAEEKAEGLILPCVAIPESALVIENDKLLDIRATL